MATAERTTQDVVIAAIRAFGPDETPGSAEGAILRGTYIGRVDEHEETFGEGTPRERKVTIKAKLGIRAEGEEFAVQFPDNPTLYAATSLLVKGEPVEVAVDLVPPYNRGDPFKFALRGTGRAARGTEWE